VECSRGWEQQAQRPWGGKELELLEEIRRAILLSEQGTVGGDEVRQASKAWIAQGPGLEEKEFGFS
jgi:hypothetical protein